MNRLILIDGNAILHRAYHALPPLTSPDGSIVNAVYGFTSMLMRIIADLKPTHIAVAFDRPAPTFRKKMFEGYQAKRPKLDDDLIPQVDKVHGLLRALGIALFEKDGYEADDVIGTIAEIAKKSFVDEIVIVTGDKDLLQLVCGNVKTFMPTKGLSEGKLYGEKETVERLGVLPKQIPDFKALAGDQSDNYPGIPGVGPKTASRLLTEFGSLEKILHVLQSKKQGKIPENLAEKIRNGKESALMSYKLATIKTDVPIAPELSELKVSTLDTPQARIFLEKLNFQSLLKRLDVSNKQKPNTSSVNKKNKNVVGDQQLSLV